MWQKNKCLLTYLPKDVLVLSDAGAADNNADADADAVDMSPA
jgi:hypothetical protein